MTTTKSTQKPKAKKKVAVRGYEGLYEVSPDGEITNVKRNLIKAQSALNSGYMRVNLSKGGKLTTMTVHRIVLEAFIGVRPDGMEASHINGNRTDNRIGNLKWESRKDNCNRKIAHGTSGKGALSTCVKLTEYEVLYMREIYNKGKLGYKKLSKAFKVTPANIYSIIKRKNWKHI